MNNSAAVIESQLASGERLVWSGRPRGGIRFRGADLFVIPFSLLWCGFAIFWEVAATRATAKGGGPVAVLFPLFGVPFVVIGLYFVFGRFIADAKMRERTFYGVTNERIIIVSGLLSRTTKSINLRTLTDVSLEERADGSGTITFGPVQYFGRRFPAGTWPGAGQYAQPAFDMIERAKETYEIIRQTQKDAMQNRQD